MSSRPSWYLPIEPFRELALNHLDREERGWNHAHAQGMEPSNEPRPSWSQIPPRELLAAKIGLSRAWVDKMLLGEYQTIHFDHADRLLCALGLHWSRNPLLLDLYRSVDLPALDRKKPTNLRRHGGGQKRKTNYSLIALLFRSGMSREEIRRRTGASKSQLERALAVEGVTSNPFGIAARPRSFDYEQAILLHDGGMSWADVARRLGVDKRTVYQAMRRIRRGEQSLIVEAAA